MSKKKEMTITQIRRERREQLRTTGIPSHWCLTHNGQSDTGAAWCNRRRQYNGQPESVENYENACEIVRVTVRR